MKISLPRPPAQIRATGRRRGVLVQWRAWRPERFETYLGETRTVSMAAFGDRE